MAELLKRGSKDYGAEVKETGKSGHTGLEICVCVEQASDWNDRSAASDKQVIGVTSLMQVSATSM